MRRLIAIFLLVLLPFQAVWAAVEPYCLHESTQSQTQHLGHHEHEHHADAQGAQHDDGAQDPSKASTMVDHDHHCCSGVSLLSAAVLLLGPLPEVDGVASLLASYASFDATRIERPNWTVSL
ncbi:MAG: cobalt-zinc-cadmium resistance protein [Aquabacterium sp.]|nr:cobalt-zinc-cadmium resistance protein [Aquabacterium sp.]